MASVREQAVALLNDAKLQADSSSKVDFLKQVMELVLHRDPELLSEFLPHLLEFQSEKGWFLRKYLTEMVELVGMKFLKHVPVMMPTLLVLLQDSAPGVIQRAIITATHLFGYTFEQLVLQGIYSGQVETWLVDAWGGMLKVKEAVFPTASQHSNDVVRLHGIKFIESTILLFTPDPNSSARPSLQAEGASKECNVAWIAGGHPILSATELGHEASRSLGILLDQLRAPDVSVLPGPVAIVLLNSLGNIAKKRPTLFGRILPVLIALGPNCEAIRGSQVTSVIHTLRTNLLGLLKCTHPGAAPWRDRLVAALRAMNAGESAEAALRQIGRVQRNADRDPATGDRRVVKEERLQGASSLFISSGEAGRKRSMVQENGNFPGDADEPVKRPRVNHSAVNLMPTTPLQLDGHHAVLQAVRGKVAGRVSQHQQVIDMTAALIAHGGERAASTIEALIARLPPDVLADVVMANMRHMPANSPTQSNGPATGSTSFDLGALVAQSVGDPRRDPRRPDRLMDREAVLGTDLGVEIFAPVKGEGADSRGARIPVAVKAEETTGPLSRDPRGALRSHPSQLPTASFRPMTVKAEPLDEAPDLKGTGEGSLPFAGGFDVPSEFLPTSTSAGPAHMHFQAPEFALHPSAVKVEDALNAAGSTKDGHRGFIQPPGPVSAPSVPIPVLPLPEEQQYVLCKAAVMRILESQKAVTAAGGGHLRTALLARLVAQSREDGILDVFRKYLLADYHGHKGHELALHVLYQLYADQASNSDSPPNLSELDPAYESFLLLLAEGLRDTLPSSDKSLSRLFGEAPVLPASALKLLEGLCNPSGQIKEEKEALNAERITQGLSTIWSLILQRPPAREACLQIALQCAVHEQEAVRTKAIRLVANKLYPVSYIAQKIEAFATDLLLSVLDIRQSPLKSPERMNVDASLSEGVEPRKETEQVNGVEGKGSAEGQTVDEKVIAGDGQRSTKGSSAAFMAEAQRCMSLFFALCTKKHSLIGELFSVYGRASKEFKQVVKQKIPLVVRSIGASSPELLKIIADPPAGSLNLLLGVLHNLSEGGALSQELISAVKKLYETKLHDASFLIPILSSYSKEEVLPIFPRLVDLPPESFQSSLDRILQGSAHSGPAMTPAEVLIALHDIDPRRESVALKKITDACSACLQQRTVFTQQVLAKVLNQMVEQTPLPLLFMRTVIQAVGAFPSLVDFVMEILSRLVNKQIWRNPKLWVGFLKCANQTMPHSFHVLLQLPALQLEDALNKQPTLRAPLAAHASQPNIRATVPRSSLVLLGIAQDVPAVDSNAPSAAPPAEISTT